MQISTNSPALILKMQGVLFGIWMILLILGFKTDVLMKTAPAKSYYFKGGVVSFKVTSLQMFLEV